MPGRRPLLNAWLCGLLLAGSAATTVRHDHDHAADSHGHLLVFGFAVYEGELPAPGPSNPSPGDIGVSVGFAAVADDGEYVPPAEPADAASPAADFSPAIPSESRPNLSRPSSPPGRCHVCDRARGERSGVRRA